MGDEIKQPDNIARVLPSNPSRSAGQRKRPRKPPQGGGGNARRQHDPDRPPHQVDEYV